MQGRGDLRERGREGSVEMGLVGRAFFVLQTGSIFSQKAGEHYGNRLYLRWAETAERERERKKERKDRGAKREVVDDLLIVSFRLVSSIPFRIRLTLAQ